MFATTLAMHQFLTSVSDPGSYKQCHSMLGIDQLPFTIELAQYHHPDALSVGWYALLSMDPVVSASLLVCFHLW